MTPMMSRKPKRNFPDNNVYNEGKIVCFDRVLAGIGSLSEHCHDETSHGDRPESPDHPGCNTGKGSIFWRFRLHTMSLLGVKDSPRPLCVKPDGSRASMQVVISVRKSASTVAGGDRYDDQAQAAWRAMLGKINPSISPHIVRDIVFNDYDIAGQVEIAANAAVMVALAGGGASVAMYLPRGATAVMMAPPEVKDDFVMWAHTSHLNIRWVELPRFNTEAHEFPYQQVTALVVEGLQRYADIHGCAIHLPA